MAALLGQATLSVPINLFINLCNLQSQCSFIFHFFTFPNFILLKIILTVLNVGAGSQLGHKFCFFPLSHPIQFDYSLFLCNLCDELNKLNYTNWDSFKATAFNWIQNRARRSILCVKWLATEYTVQEVKNDLTIIIKFCNARFAILEPNLQNAFFW